MLETRKQRYPFAITGLGVRLVLVVGARMQINRALLESGHMPQYTDGMRVTDAGALQVAIEAAGSTRMEIEARLSRVCVCVGMYYAFISAPTLCTHRSIHHTSEKHVP